MPTPTEKRIIQRRRAKGVLVPLLEELHEKPVEFDDADDFRFMDLLLRARAVPREKGVFSPSMLGSCLRQSWFAKRGTEKHPTTNPQTNGYFNKGNFVHQQWQFAVWKAHRAGLLELARVPSSPELSCGVHQGMHWRWAVEVRVMDSEEDEGGTIDVIVVIDGTWYIVDFKGINLQDFMKQVKRGADPKYRKQIVGYAKIWNKTAPFDALHIQDCLLVAECKAGPVSGTNSPLALHETHVSVAEFNSEVDKRLRTLHWYDDRDEQPPPECVSTAHMQYQECPFSRYCRDEVKVRQREREAAIAKAPKSWSVHRP